MNIKKYISAVLIFLTILSCSEDKDVLIPFAKDITLNELELGRFTHEIPDGGFNSDVVHFNTVKNSDGSFSGFAFSNRNNRSFTYTNSQAAIDSNRFSVYTKKPNYSKVYAVACVKDDDAYLTLENPTVVEHILVGNTTYNFLALKYGDSHGTEEKPEKNINIYSGEKSIWYSNVPGGVKKMTTDDNDFFKLIIKGFEGTTEKGEVEFYFCSMGGDPNNPTYDYVIDDWYKVDLASLGEVDKLVFYLESSDVDSDTGKMRTPSYFCIDGIRLKK